MVFLTAATICDLLLVVPSIWAAFFVEMTPARALSVVAVVAIVTLAEFLGLGAVIGGPGSDEVEWCSFFWGINLGQIVIVFVCLRTLRDFVGFRLIRLGDAFSPDAGGTSTSNS